MLAEQLVFSILLLGDWSCLCHICQYHKINSGAVSIEKDKDLTPAHSLKSTRASHGAKY